MVAIDWPGLDRCECRARAPTLASSVTTSAKRNGLALDGAGRFRCRPTSSPRPSNLSATPRNVAQIAARAEFRDPSKPLTEHCLAMRDAVRPICCENQHSLKRMQPVGRPPTKLPKITNFSLDRQRSIEPVPSVCFRCVLAQTSRVHYPQEAISTQSLIFRHHTGTIRCPSA